MIKPFLALITFFFIPLASWGHDHHQTIAAIVNENLITENELQDRINLAIRTSGLPDTKETREKITPSLRNTLIEEELQIQEAKKHNVTASPEEIENGFSVLAQNNGTDIDSLKTYLKEKNINFETLRHQIKAHIVWSKLVQDRFQAESQVSEDEIKQMKNRLQASAGKPEYLVASIFLAVDSPSKEKETEKFAQQLIDQLAKGADFISVARQFSQAAGAENGGDLGWVQQGQLTPALSEALQKMSAGHISPPIRDAAGYHILLLRDVRSSMEINPADIELKLKQTSFPWPENSTDEDKKAYLAALEKKRANLHGCSTMADDMGIMKMGEIEQNLAAHLGDLPIGQPSEILHNQDGAVILMVCERIIPEGNLPSNDQITEIIGTGKLDMLQRRYLRDLRRSAFIDIRS